MNNQQALLVKNTNSWYLNPLEVDLEICIIRFTDAPWNLCFTESSLNRISLILWELSCQDLSLFIPAAPQIRDPKQKSCISVQG